MNILGRRNQLMHIVLDLQLSQPLPPLDKLIESLVLAQLQYDVNELGVLEEVLEADYIGGVYFGVDLYL